MGNCKVEAVEPVPKPIVVLAVTGAIFKYPPVLWMLLFVPTRFIESAVKLIVPPFALSETLPADVSIFPVVASAALKLIFNVSPVIAEMLV